MLSIIFNVVVTMCATAIMVALVFYSAWKTEKKRNEQLSKMNDLLLIQHNNGIESMKNKMKIIKKLQHHREVLNSREMQT